MKKLILYFLLACSAVFADRLFLVVLSTPGVPDEGGGEPSPPVGASFVLPQYTPVEPTSSYPAGFDSFLTPTNIAAADGTVEVAEWTRISDPGDTMIFTGENIESTNTTVVYYTPDGTTNAVAYTGHIQTIDGRQVAVTLPTNLTANVPVMMWAWNSAGWGEPVMINRTQADWLSFGEIAAGETFYIYGKNLSLDGTNAYCYIEELDTWLTNSVVSTAFRAGFNMPGSATNGTYTVYAHNGHGREYGWDTNALSVTVASDYTWSANQFVVTNYGAVPDDGNDDYTAIIDAYNAASAGDTIYFPDGVYETTNQITIGKRLKWVGESTNAVVSGQLDSHNVFGGSSSAADGTQFHDLKIHSQGRKICIYFFNIDDVLIDGCILSQYPSDEGGSGGPFTIQKGIRHHYTNTIFECAFGFDVTGSLPTSQDLRIENCTFLGVYDCNQLSAFNSTPFNIDFSNNYFGNKDPDADPKSGDLLGKGRVLVFNSGDKIYVGGNNITNYAPRIPTPWLVTNIVSIGSLGVETNLATHNIGRIGPVTLTDIPAVYDNRGNNSLNYDGASVSCATTNGGTAFGYVIDNDAATDTLEVLFYGVETNDYLAIDTSSGMATLKDITDQNSGEMLLMEGFQTRQAGNVLSGTSSNITISVADASETSTVQDSTTVFITGGKGIGQARYVSGIVTNTGVVTVERPWRVVPDNTSTYELTSGTLSIHIVNNRFSGRDSQIGYDHKANTSLQLSVSHGLVYSGNILDKMRHVIRLYGHSGEGAALAGESGPAPNYFAVIQDNTVRGTAYGFDNIIKVEDVGEPLVTGDAFNLGNVFRGNYITNITYRNPFGFWSDFDTNSNTYGLTVIESNTVEGFTFVTNSFGASFYAQPIHIDDISAGPLVLRNNSFTGNSNIMGVTNSNLRLSGNTWSGFSATYTNSATNAWIEIPVRTVAATNASSVTVYNSGGTEVTWSATDNGMVNILTNSGTVAAESSGLIYFDFTGSPTNEQSAVITVTGPNNTNLFTVIYKGSLTE